MRVVSVWGGGCYGTFYAGQLAKAKQRSRADYRCVVVVDRDPGCRARAELGDAPDRRFVCRDWSACFAAVLGGAARPRPGEPEDYIVPSPLMPHLMFEWMLARARERWAQRAIPVMSGPRSLRTPLHPTAPRRAR